MGIINDILYTNKNALFSKKALDVYVQKSAVTTSNIANADTPGYKAVKVKPFEKELMRAYKQESGMKMTTTNPAHLNGGSNTLRNFEPKVTVSTEPGRMDGNNVDLDKEITDMSENLIMYRAMIVARTKRGKMISGAMESR